MKKYLFCLAVLAVVLGLSCATAPVTPTTVTQPTTPPPAPTPAPSNTVTTPAPPPPPPPQPLVMLSAAGLDMADAVEYTIVYGDYLSEITRTFYGHLTDVGPAGTRNGFYYPVLMLASEDQIKDPDFILEGMKIKIPDLKKNLENPATRTAIKTILAQVAALYGNKNLLDEKEGLQRLADSL